MTNELQAYTDAGLDLYAVLLSATGHAWNGSALEVIDSGSWTDYDIAMTEAVAGLYLASMPAVAAGLYSYIVYEQVGGTPAVTDTIRGNGWLAWDGSSETSGGLTAQDTRDAMKLAPSAGAPAAGSVDAHLDSILEDTALIEEIKAITDALDVTAVTQVAANASGALTITCTLDFATTVSGLTIPVDWTKCYWTVKRSTDDPDADALIQILESNPGDADDGVQILMGEAIEDESDGSLTVNQALGTVTIALGNASTALLEDAVELVWDVKVHNPAGKTQPGAGTATIATAVTRA